MVVILPLTAHAAPNAGRGLNVERAILTSWIPEGIGVKYSRLVTGRTIAEDFPEDAQIHMSPAREGIELGS